MNFKDNAALSPISQPSLAGEFWRLAELSVKGDDRGSLVALEMTREIPFKIARVYYIFGTQPGVVRGLHAHRQLQQFCVVVNGQLRMELDDGRKKASIILNRPDQGLFIGPGVWREMHDFSPDCVLMVLADAPHQEADYIRNKQEFINYVHSSNC
jgi:dTDP-4-dehydrorhamnose 3,5-epimerase-like enzyme